MPTESETEQTVESVPPPPAFQDEKSEEGVVQPMTLEEEIEEAASQSTTMEPENGARMEPAEQKAELAEPGADTVESAPPAFEEKASETAEIIIIISSFLYGALNIHLYALYKQTAEWGKHSSIVLKSNTQLATAPTVYVTLHFWNIVSVWVDEF